MLAKVMINLIEKNNLLEETLMQKIDLYCKCCKKTMKMSYNLTGDMDAPVLPGMTIRCHTHKCTRIMILKKYTEKLIVTKATKDGKCYI